WLRLASGITFDSAAPRAPSSGVSVTALSGKGCPGEDRSASPAARSTTATQGPARGSVSRIVQASQGAVVQVVPFSKEGTPRNCASGFFISADGTIVTAAHAIQGARDILIRISSGAVFSVDGVSALDSQADVAILKVSGQGLPALRLGDS